MALPPGLYEKAHTEELEAELERLARNRSRSSALSDSEAPLFLAKATFGRLVHALSSYRGDDAIEQQLRLANRVLELIRAEAPRAGALSGDRFTEPGKKLLAVLPEPPSGLGSAVEPERPGVPLSSSDLLVNSRRDLSLGPELKKEIASADRIDLLCSFLKWSGVRLVQEALREFCQRRPGGLRVITTTYLEATQGRALDALLDLGAELRVSYDTRRTRLHAKAWLFHRRSGFSTGYIGSSNLSHQALIDGLEWNVRVSQVDNGAILEKFGATFDHYWNDVAFEPYATEQDRERFDRVVKSQLRNRSELLLAIQLFPRPHQERILESLAAERERGRCRNLVVAATGTGKTVVAALDYARIRKAAGEASLLFVAHREEILKQSHLTFQVALKDGGFGELLVSGETPRSGKHVFASIQSLHADRLAEIPRDAYDVVIVDEFHHARAATYERLLAHLAPKFLLGLTATPERADGKNVLGWFDGRIAAELRLWEALDQGLLSPFQYFGIADHSDLSSLRWTRGRYPEKELSNLYTGDHLRAKRVLQELYAKVADVSEVSALGFCVSIDHADFMADQFNEAGIVARSVSSRTPKADRRAALAQLRAGQVRILFTVDLFNEGVDLPDVDTILMLRPTESATVFLQQLGRGLRLAEGKECLTVLDFIGRQHRKFRFDTRFRSIVGGTRRQIQRTVERGFPRLPSGCSIQLDRLSTERVLENIKSSLGIGRRGLIEDLRGIGHDVSLQEFLAAGDLDLEDIYGTAGASWTRLRREAGLPTSKAGAQEEPLLRAVARMIYTNDVPRIEHWRSLLARDAPPVADPSDSWQRLLFVALGNARRSYDEMSEAWAELWECQNVRLELFALLDVLEDRLRRRTPRLEAALPLCLHADYSLDEVTCAFDVRTQKNSVLRQQSGVLYVEPHKTDLLSITLEKNEADYTPSTMYNDYPISERLFHWESQSAAHPGTKTGRRYIEHQKRGGSVVLFVRQSKRDARGFTAPYTCLGLARYVRHEGARPMKILWELEHPMPAELYEEFKVAAG